MRDVLARVFMVRPDRDSWLAAGVWSVAALASLTVAVWIAVQPDQLKDLHTVRTWLSFVLNHTGDPYAYFDRELDYPPLALLVLSPLALIPEHSLALWFIPISLGVTAVAGWVFVGAIGERLYTNLSTQQRVAIVAMLLAGSSARGAIWLGQTVALSVLFGALALSWSRKRPFAAGIALALCSFKPHLGVGFGLAILLIDGFDVIAIALAIVTSASLLVAAAIDQSVLTILASYAHNLVAMYDGPERIRGMLSIRWVFDDVIGYYGAATLAYAAAACASLVLIGTIARRAPDAAGRVQVTAVALLWPLLFLPSQLYNGLLAAPALWLLMWPEGNLIRRESHRLAVAVTFVLFGVTDLPRLIRLASERLDNGYWLYQVSYYLSPLRMAIIFGFILTVAYRQTRSAESRLAQ